MVRAWKLFLGLSLVLALPGCGDKKSHKTDTSVKKTYIVKGDPGELIKGAQTNPESPLTENNILELNDFILSSALSFEEKEAIENSPKDQKQLEAQNAPKDRETSVRDVQNIRVEKDSKGHWQIKLLNGALALKLQVTKNQRWQVYAIESIADSMQTPIQVVHWSVTPDRDFMSLLLKSYGETTGRTLTALYFEKKSSAKTIPQVDKKYIYTAGAGKKVSWFGSVDSKINLQYCGMSSDFEASAKQMGYWQSALKGLFTINFTYASTYEPFSDLNQHCIYVVDTFLQSPDPDAATYGVTASVMSIAKVKYIDSDILMFKGEFKKIETAMIGYGYPSSLATRYAFSKYYPALLHEMGHMLGLDHKFDGTASIMSYSFTESVPSSYDIEAIQQLYTP